MTLQKNSISISIQGKSFLCSRKIVCPLTIINTSKFAEM